MENQSACQVLCAKAHRSLPIPREVNNFILRNYGALYYLSTNPAEKIQILQAIEKQLQTAGYAITWQEVERRLKNMKSHYRRKQNDLRIGLVSSVDWEYFETLNNIFGPMENLALSTSPASSNQIESDDQKPEVKIEKKTQPEKPQQKPKPEKPQRKPQTEKRQKKQEERVEEEELKPEDL